MKTPTPRPDGHGALMVGGVPGNAGGGRPKEVWRRHIRKALERAGGVDFLVRVVKGEVKEQVVDNDGNLVEIPPKVRDRIVAANILIEQAFGKPPQHVQIEDERLRPTGEETMARIVELLPRVVRMLPADKREELARLLTGQRAIEVLVSGQQVTDRRSENRNGL